jgi:Leucine-rich repeat (LRR) protein
VSNRHNGSLHCGVIQLPRAAPTGPCKPSVTELALMRPLMRAHEDALAAQAEGLDLERLSRTYAALMSRLLEVAGMRVHTVELTPDTLWPVLPKVLNHREYHHRYELYPDEYPPHHGSDTEDEDADMDKPVSVPRGGLAELGLLSLSGEVQELRVRSGQLKWVPEWLGKLTRLETLDIGGVHVRAQNKEIKRLPLSLVRLGKLKQLTLAHLKGLKKLRDNIALSTLGILKVEHCCNLRVLPPRLGQLGAMQELMLHDLPELRVLPDLSGLTSLRSLEISLCCTLKALPSGFGEMIALKKLTIYRLDQLRTLSDIFVLTALHCLMIANCGHSSAEVKALPKKFRDMKSLKELTLKGFADLPDIRLTAALCSLTIEDCRKLKVLPKGMVEMNTLNELTLCCLAELWELPNPTSLCALGSLTIDNCNKLQALPESLQKLRALKQLTLRRLNQLREMPNPTALTVLDSLTIELCPNIKVLPTSLGRLGALKQLTLRGLDELQKLPDPVGLTSLERLTLGQCKKLKALPVSIMHVSRLRHLSIDWCPLEDMPCIKTLTALHTLELYVKDYYDDDDDDDDATKPGTHSSRAFKALSRSLPYLKQLEVLRLGGGLNKTFQDTVYVVALRAGDVRAIGRALKAWPLPLLYNILNAPEYYNERKYYDMIRLSEFRQTLRLPAAADWTNARTLDFFRMQQHKVAVFASWMHTRLGAASSVLWLNEQALMMIADELLGRWALLKEWQKDKGEQDESEEKEDDEEEEQGEEVPLTEEGEEDDCSDGFDDSSVASSDDSEDVRVWAFERGL